MTTTHDRLIAYRIGKLCVGGDAALVEGDFAALRSIAKRLAAYAHEPLHCQLVDLADACRSDAALAGTLWGTLKERVYRTVHA